MPDFSNDSVFAKEHRKERWRAFRHRVVVLFNLIIITGFAGFCVGMWGETGRRSEQLADASAESAMMPLQRVSTFVSHGVLFARKKSTLLLAELTGSRPDPTARMPSRPSGDEPATPEPIANPIAEPKPRPTQYPKIRPPQPPPAPQAEPADEPKGTEVLPSEYPFPRPQPEPVNPQVQIVEPPKPRVSPDVQKLIDMGRAEFKIANGFYQQARPEAPSAGRPAATLQCAAYLRKAKQYYDQALTRPMPPDVRKQLQAELTRTQQMLYWMNKFSPAR